MHQCDMVMDFQFGSTGKGLLAGYLAKRCSYDSVVCSFATNAGHTYIDAARNINMMTQQLPTGISSPTVTRVFIGPGSLIHLSTLQDELQRYKDMLAGKQIYVHPAAAIVLDTHAYIEQAGDMARIGSTTKGVGEAMIQRIRRNPHDQNVAGADPYKQILGNLGIIVDGREYDHQMDRAESILVEGAQGFSLSMYHGFYPYTTSRDVTPWQIAADCGLPFKWASRIQVWGTLRTFPIRVNNRTGTSGPGYPDQQELSWADVGAAAELTTVTKLPRRVFSFSVDQLHHALWHCGGYWKTNLFLNFANYLKSDDEVIKLIERIEQPDPASRNLPNPPKVCLLGFGPDDANVQSREDL